MHLKFFNAISLLHYKKLLELFVKEGSRAAPDRGAEGAIVPLLGEINNSLGYSH